MTKLLLPYIIIFLLNIIEGSIVTVGAGVAIRNSEIQFWITYLVIVSADVISDFLYYYIGRKSNGIFESPYLRFVGVTPLRLKKVTSFYDKHGVKTLITAKLSYFFAVPAIVLAGSTNMNSKKFAIMSVCTAAVKGLLLLIGG
jgi:membrane protein DedA with SNARE-associated domain